MLTVVKFPVGGGCKSDCMLWVGGGLCAKVRLCVVGGLNKVRVGSIIIIHNLLLIPINLRLPTMIMMMVMMMLRSMAKVDGLVRQ